MIMFTVYLIVLLSKNVHKVLKKLENLENKRLGIQLMSLSVKITFIDKLDKVKTAMSALCNVIESL